MTPDNPPRAAASLVRAFDDADVVAIADVHELQDLGDFLGQLIREPGFAEACNDIVVECGNSRYQPVADRFVAGEDVAPAELFRIWRDTTQPAAWDSPVYGQLFVRVREANRDLPAERRLRVLLADVPIEWSAIRTAADLAPFTALREAHFAGILEAQVLRKGRKALFWAGGSHVVRKPANIPNPIVLIERRGTGKTFIALTHGGFEDQQTETRLSAWDAPALLHLEGSWLGRLDASAYFGHAKGRGPVNPYAGTRLEQAADAYLFLGDRDALTWTPAPEDIYEGAYGEECERRRKLVAELASLAGAR